MNSKVNAISDIGFLLLANERIKLIIMMMMFNNISI